MTREDYKGQKYNKDMRVKLKPKDQVSLFRSAIIKIGSERKLANKLNTSKGAIYHYKKSDTTLPYTIYLKILDLTNQNPDTIETKKIKNNWGQVKGGKNLIKIKKSNGTFQNTIEKLAKCSSNRMKKYHQESKQKDPESYYKKQFEIFKGNKRSVSKLSKQKLRNYLELEVENRLIKLKLEFDYEPFLLIGKKAYFPDFMIKKSIIEVTYWSRPSKEKINYLKKKVEDYKKAGYNIVFFVPPTHRNFYKCLGCSVITDFAKLEEYASVA